LLKETGG
jgi:phosphoribosyl 1,2-cyclic phosphodiesterase/uncharacterized membrane protein YtjA (UPF0391 family)